MNNSTHTQAPWILCMDDLTIRAIGQTGISNCMADYRGVIIADLKPSLGIEESDVENGALGVCEFHSYLNGGGSRQHAWEEVLANGRSIVRAINDMAEPARQQNHEVEMPEIADRPAPTAAAYLRHNFGILMTSDEQRELQDAVLQDIALPEPQPNEQLLEEVLETIGEVVDQLSQVDYNDYTVTAEKVGLSKYLLDRLAGTIESYK